MWRMVFCLVFRLQFSYGDWLEGLKKKETGWGVYSYEEAYNEVRSSRNFPRFYPNFFFFFITGHVFQNPEVINLVLEPGIW